MPWAISAEAVPKTAFRAGVSLSALAYSFSALNALGIKRGNGSQGPWLSESLVVRIHGYPRKCLGIVFSEPCFVTSEVPMRFPELIIFYFGSSDGSGAPIWEPWGCIFGVLEFQRHCEKHA